MQVQDDMNNAKHEGLTTRKLKKAFEEMLNAIRDSLSDFASSDDEENVEDKEDNEEDTEQGKMSEDDEPGWVMGTMSKTVQYRRESFQPKQIKLDELTQLGWGDKGDYFISKMYFSLWKPLGVSERMWSVNLKVSI